MEIFVPQTMTWVWAIVALVLMPISAAVLQKLDLDENREPETGKNIAGGAVVGVFWPFILLIGLAALIFVFPTWYLVTVMTTRHMKRKREAATEREVLARIEAEKQAEDERIRREIDGEPEPVPWKRKSENLNRLKQSRKLTIDGGKLEIQLDWGGSDRQAAEAEEAAEAARQAEIVVRHSERRRRMKAAGMSDSDIAYWGRTADSEVRRFFG